MKKTSESLDKILDVESVEIAETTENKMPIQLIETGNPIDDDTEFARQNIKQLIVKGNKAMDEILNVANASEHPRAYEVAAGLIKNLSDLNKDLLELQKRKKDLLPKQTENNNNLNIDKAVFVGSTTDLIKMLKQSKKEQ